MGILVIIIVTIPNHNLSFHIFFGHFLYSYRVVSCFSFLLFFFVFLSICILLFILFSPSFLCGWSYGFKHLAIYVYTCMVFVFNGIRVVHDGGDLQDVVEPFVEKKLGCEEHNFIFWNLEKIVCVCVCVCAHLYTMNVVGICVFSLFR